MVRETFIIGTLLITCKRPFLLHLSEKKIRKEGSLNSKHIFCFNRTWMFIFFFFFSVPHKDEEQVKLDVTRSFNSYPKSKGLGEIKKCSSNILLDINEEEKEKLKVQLHRVILHVLRLYPSLHYYQVNTK